MLAGQRRSVLQTFVLVHDRNDCQDLELADQMTCHKNRLPFTINSVGDKE